MTEPDDDEYEHEVLELAQLDYLLDAEQRRLDELLRTDPLRFWWFE